MVLIIIVCNRQIPHNFQVSAVSPVTVFASGYKAPNGASNVRLEKSHWILAVSFAQKRGLP